MDKDFLSSSAGSDSTPFQHLFWFFGHPEVWVMLFLWTIILIAIIKVIKRLWRPRKVFQLITFLIITGISLAYYIWLSKNAHVSYVEGRGDELMFLPYAKRTLFMISTLSFVWIVRDWVKSKRSN